MHHYYRINSINKQSKYHMNKKTRRHLEIRKIVNAHKIRRQEELLNLLLQHGFNVTQATLSRDLQELKVGKVHDPHEGNVYFVPDQYQAGQLPSGGNPLSGLRSAFLKKDSMIIKTRPGFASSIAAQIDEKDIHFMGGTIAGNDTVLIMFKQDMEKDNVIETFNRHYPELVDLIPE